MSWKEEPRSGSQSAACLCPRDCPRLRPTYEPGKPAKKQQAVQPELPGLELSLLGNYDPGIVPESVRQEA